MTQICHFSYRHLTTRQGRCCCCHNRLIVVSGNRHTCWKASNPNPNTATRNALGIKLLEQRDCWELIKFKGLDWRNYTIIKFSLQPSSASIQVLRTSKQDSRQWESAAWAEKSAAVKVETLEGGLMTDCTLKNERRSRLLNEKKCEEGCC